MSSIAPKRKTMEFRVLVGQHVANDPGVEETLGAKTVPELVQIIRDRGIIHHPNLDLNNKSICLKLLRDNGAMQVCYSPATGWFRSYGDLCAEFNRPGMHPKFERKVDDGAVLGETHEQMILRKKRELDDRQAELKALLDGTPDAPDEDRPDFGNMTLGQLQNFASVNKIDLKGAKSQEAIVKILKALEPVAA